MEQMTHFTRGLKAQVRMLLDASIEGAIKTKNEEEVKKLIKECSRMSIAQQVTENPTKLCA